MPAKSSEFWQHRQGLANPCHYLDRWTDWYAWVLRRRGIARIWPWRRVETVLDLGCGDGRYGNWLAERFGVVVTGLDQFRYQDVEKRLAWFVLGDAECATDRLRPAYDLVCALTLLSFVSDARAAIREMTALATRYCLVVENTQTPTPLWQKGLDYKTHLNYRLLVAAFGARGFRLVRQSTINVLDRQWLVSVPTILRVPTMLLTLVIDLLLARFVRPESARYTALLFRREA